MPEVIDFLIVYEAPVIKMLPEGDAEKWRSFVYDIYTKSQREGSLAAQAEFMASLINVPNSPFPTDSMIGSLVTSISSSNMSLELSLDIYPMLRALEKIMCIL